MMRHRRLRFKALLIGLATAKIGVTLLYLAGSVSVTEVIFRQQTAIAQDPQAVKKEVTEAENETPQPRKPKDPAVDVRAILNRLDVERKRLSREEERIGQQREQLEELKEEIEEKIERLSFIQKQIAADLDKKETMLTEREQQQKASEEANMKMLGKVYASMKPKQAAAIVDNMDIEIIQKIFSYMKGEQVGNILSYVDKERAAKISERLAEQNVTVTEPKQTPEPKVTEEDVR